MPAERSDEGGGGAPPLVAFAGAIFFSAFATFWNWAVFAQLLPAVLLLFSGSCSDGPCTNGVCYDDDGDDWDGGGGYRRLQAGDGCALNAEGTGCATPGGRCSFSNDPAMGVFLGCFSLPFVVAGVIVTSAAAAAWLSLFPCCAPAARRLERCCAPQRGYQQLLMALFLTTFALGWNMAVCTQLLPLAAGMFSASCTGSSDGTGGAPCEAIADGSRCAVEGGDCSYDPVTSSCAGDDDGSGGRACATNDLGTACAVQGGDCVFEADVGMGVFLLVFAIPFVAAGCFQVVAAARMWEEACPCFGTVLAVCRRRERGAAGTGSAQSSDGYDQVSAAPLPVVASEPFDAARASHSGALAASVRQSAPLIATV